MDLLKKLHIRGKIVKKLKEEPQEAILPSLKKGDSDNGKLFIIMVLIAVFYNIILGLKEISNGVNFIVLLFCRLFTY